MALAKLGQKEQLQTIYRKISTGNELQVTGAMDSLSYIGGWFSVKVLDSVLSGEIAAKPALDPHAPADGQFVPPRMAATSALTQMFPDAVQPTSDNFRDRESFWLTYIGTR